MGVRFQAGDRPVPQAVSLLKRFLLWLLRVPECTACGRCCAPGLWAGPHNAHAFVDMNRKDVERLRRRERRELVDRDAQDKPHMRMVILNNVQQCVNLGGTPGQSVSCRIYARRPDACRDWSRGGWRCLTVLSWARRPLRDFHSSRPGTGWFPWWADWARPKHWYRTRWSLQRWEQYRWWGAFSVLVWLAVPSWRGWCTAACDWTDRLCRAKSGEVDVRHGGASPSKSRRFLS